MPKTLNILPDFSIELKLSGGSGMLIAGVDEVGRGTLAGPVLAAAAILPEPVPIEHEALVNDSKILSPATREKAFSWLVKWCVSYGIGTCSAAEIDSIGIVASTKQAMIRAVAELDPQPHHLIIDALQLPAVSMSQTSIVKADSRSQSVAAASIIAKVARDKLRANVFEQEYPGYGFASHKGYGTEFHMLALKELGASPIHRQSFKPIRDLL